jgi:glutathione peroxidase
LWAWLSREKRGLLGSARIKWNFSKFLVDRQGRVVSRHAPTTKPEQLRDEIEAVL